MTTRIQWKIHLASSLDDVYAMLTTDTGRARFWAESTREYGNDIFFQFPSGISYTATIIERAAPHLFKIMYYGGSLTTFRLFGTADMGTELHLTDEGGDLCDYADVSAGWVSVLLALKAAVDFKVDLRNHDSKRSWDHGFVDN